jgi:hydroxymethylpyrimidine pyrophosphatase-like HAD family hydrolase
MKHISEMTKSDVKDIKLLVLDVDGVLVHRGTKIRQKGNVTTLETKKIALRQIEQIRELNEKGFLININSGRGLYMLQEMFRDVLEFVSLTYENGSATWFKGKIIQHVNSFDFLKDVFRKLKKIEHKNIKGFEPKEFIITIHCTNRVSAIEKLMNSEKKLYYIWNGEAYDIGVKKKQLKSVGLLAMMHVLKLKKQHMLVIGDNYNDADMMHIGGIAVTADRDRVKGNFYVQLEGKKLPADVLMEKLLELR